MELHERVVEGWQISAEGYSDIINDELIKDDAVLWTKMLKKLLPKSEKPLRILDVGTGPGFFAIILSKLGHQVVGIDVTQEMVYFAKNNADKEGVAPLFLQMDSQKLTFPENTFDLIISRNVVWTLDQPLSAYCNWHKVLKPEGKLIVFDADYLADIRDEALKTIIEANRKEYIDLYGKPKVSFEDYEKARGFRVNLPLADKKRPDWDLEILNQLEFKDFGWQDVSKDVYNEQRFKLYKYQPMFMLWGIK
ncbi:class I SAM-dependent methyltransferase [Acetobacterium sp.]|uniref:class I SAM-dependent methyltransferase n=1 Tax=Acetobacterium sp. TaxID=1872094 RepID=UPI002725E7C9|nr:class I SAM-dependent methyltransferase [Acetobacterium sp.]MDO9491542.1 methyltransferase domain-containing protein [Acetobacterium sp.]